MAMRLDSYVTYLPPATGEDELTELRTICLRYLLWDLDYSEWCPRSFYASPFEV